MLFSEIIALLFMAPNIRKEVLQLISLNELTGGHLNEDEIQIVKNCTKEQLDAAWSFLVRGWVGLVIGRRMFEKDCSHPRERR